MERFFSFEELIGSSLAKGAYYVGLCVIALVSIILAIAGGKLGGGLGAIIPLAVGACSILIWRLSIEVIILAFLIYDRLGRIQQLLAGGAAETEPHSPAESASSEQTVPASSPPHQADDHPKPMFCSRCGTGVPEGGRFCEKCGAAVSSTDFN